MNYKKIFQIIILITALVFAVAIGRYYFKKFTNPAFDWKIFKNPEFGYSFKYPTSSTVYLFSGIGEDYKVLEETGTSSIVNVFKDYPYGHLFQVYAENTLLDKVEMSYIDKFYPSTTRSQFKTAGANGYKIEIKTGTSTPSHFVYFLLKNEKIYVVDLISPEKSSEIIFSTLRFYKNN